MDNSHVALVSVNLKTEGFTEFRCDRPITLGVNIAALTKVLKCAKDDDEVVLKANDTADLLHLTYNAKGTSHAILPLLFLLRSHPILMIDANRVAEYDIKLMDIDQETLGIPETDYDATVAMASNEFARLCRDQSVLGESVRIEVSKEGVRFTSEGDSANGSVMLKPDSAVRSMKTKVKKEDDEDARMDEDASEDDGGAKDDEEEEENEEEEEEGSSKKRKRSKASADKARKNKKPRKSGDGEDEDKGVKIVMSQQVNLTFSLKYLQNFAKSSSLCNRVTLSMSNEVPLLVS
jgi:proliferating cell nuclear antigen